jgi:putative photosynthetic complex assembly protein 2
MNVATSALVTRGPSTPVARAEENGAGPNPQESRWRTFVVAAVASIAIWWSSTAILIFLNFLPGARPFMFVVGAGLAIGGVVWLLRNRSNTTVSGAYLGFTAGILVWAFVESSFYTGYIVGPEVAPLAVDGPSWPSFVRAFTRSMYHEVLVLTLGVAGLFAFHGARNRVGLWVFLILWFFHQSAKLNVFLGVANTGSEFLPEPVADLTPHMTTAPINLLFPLSVTINTLVAAYLLRRGLDRGVARWQRVGYVLVGTMAALALLEHWLLVLPLESTLFDVSLN